MTVWVKLLHVNQWKCWSKVRKPLGYLMEGDPVTATRPAAVMTVAQRASKPGPELTASASPV